MNTTPISPYLLCPQCKGRVRVDAALQNGVAKCPVCREAGLLAMHHSGMGRRAGRLVVLMIATVGLLAALWVRPGMGNQLAVSAGQIQAWLGRIPVAEGNPSYFAVPADIERPAPADVVVADGEMMISSLDPNRSEAVANYEEVARLHRMVSASGAQMEPLRKKFIADLEAARLTNVFDSAKLNSKSFDSNKAIQTVSALAAKYATECEVLARDLRLAISEAKVSEASRERGLVFLRSMIVREEVLWDDVMLAVKEGGSLAPRLAAATDRGATKTNADKLAALNTRWKEVRSNLARPVMVPPLPSSASIASQNLPLPHGQR